MVRTASVEEELATATWDSAFSKNARVVAGTVSVGVLSSLGLDYPISRYPMQMHTLNIAEPYRVDFQSQNEEIKPVNSDFLPASSKEFYSTHWRSNHIEPIASVLSEADLLSFELITKITSYLNMSKGWDGFEAEPISEKAVAEALRFVDLVSPMLLSRPSVAPSGDGEVMLSWKKGNKYLEVSFYGEKVLYWFFKSSSESRTGDESFSGNSVSRELENFINEIQA